MGEEKHVVKWKREVKIRSKITGVKPVKTGVIGKMTIKHTYYKVQIPTTDYMQQNGSHVGVV